MASFCKPSPPKFACKTLEILERQESCVTLLRYDRINEFKSHSVAAPKAVVDLSGCKSERYLSCKTSFVILMRTLLIISGDASGAVVCFWCGLVSGCWSIGEDAWIRHARSSRYCQFVLNEKGAEFVATAIEEHGLFSENRRDEDRIRVCCNLKYFHSSSSNYWSNAILKSTMSWTFVGIANLPIHKGLGKRLKLLFSTLISGLSRYK